MPSGGDGFGEVTSKVWQRRHPFPLILVESFVAIGRMTVAAIRP